MLVIADQSHTLDSLFDTSTMMLYSTFVNILEIFSKDIEHVYRICTSNLVIKQLANVYYVAFEPDSKRR